VPRHELEIARRNQARPHLEHSDQAWLAALSHLQASKRWSASCRRPEPLLPRTVAWSPGTGAIPTVGPAGAEGGSPHRHSANLLPRLGHQLHLEAVGVLEVAGVVLGTAGVGMAIGEQQRPAMLSPFGHQSVHVSLMASVEGEVVESGSAAIMNLGRQRRGLLHDDVVISGAPTAPARPVLVDLVAEGAEQPPPAVDGACKIGDPDLDVVQAPGDSIGRGEALIRALHPSHDAKHKASVDAPVAPGLAYTRWYSGARREQCSSVPGNASYSRRHIRAASPARRRMLAGGADPARPHQGWVTSAPAEPRCSPVTRDGRCGPVETDGTVARLWPARGYPAVGKSPGGPFTPSEQPVCACPR